MDGSSNRYGAAKNLSANLDIACLICAAILLPIHGSVHAATASATLRVSARVVSSCRILTNSSEPAKQDVEPFQPAANRVTSTLLTTHCGTNPGSPTTMAVSTESSNSSEPVIEVISDGTAGGHTKQSNEIIQGTRNSDAKIIHWGLHPAGAHLLVSISSQERTGEPIRSNNGDSPVKLIIDY